MQNKQIQVDHWYQTKHGIGQCLAIAGKVRFKFKFRDPMSVVWLTVKDVQYEIPKGEEPQSKKDEDKPSDTFRHCPHCQARTKHVVGEPAPEVCVKCGKSLLVTVEPSLEAKVAHLETINAELLAKCKTAMQALRSYQYHNASTELAEEVADALDVVIAKAQGVSA